MEITEKIEAPSESPEKITEKTFKIQLPKNVLKEERKDNQEN